MNINLIKKYGLAGFVFLGAMLLAVYLFILTHDCPASICINPVAYAQRRGNAWVTSSNKTQGYLLLENKNLAPRFQAEKCFWQDEAYIFLCQAIDNELVRPKAFSYALSRRNNLKSYVGGVFIVKATNGKKIAQTIVCEAQSPGIQLLPPPLDQERCGANSIQVEEQFIP
ncbi:type IV pilin-like G/H family protein [Alkalinema sp. FACHB-956]|uniref:type IV pilin-like G/H family protein n=1 Tax=Alkalinema sp. FACHB-956 TaxID=2692768 RepID=UPI0016869D66|nr:type IV pilin-like G/H family protein [Alkalinema sp. FACHB-956]MBD2329370.1 hypothetical protein [Alkalinema sp. FACHB-956]